MKGRIFLLLLLGLALSWFPPASGVFAQSVTGARAAILIDVNTGKIIYAKNENLPIAPASITKIMTLYLTLEAIESGRIHWSDLVPVSAQAAQLRGTRMYLTAHSRVRLRDLVLGTAVASANDAAWALAEFVGGDVNTFVQMMNDKAKALGMRHTVFKNPNGLPAPGQVTTAADIAVLSRAYLKRFPQALTLLHSRATFRYAGRTLRNRNHLLGHYPGADGIKTGFVCAAGYNISATAKRGNTRLIAVVLGAPTFRIRDRETVKLLDSGFRKVNHLAPRRSGIKG